MVAQLPVPRQVIRKAFPGIPETEADQMARSGQVHRYPPNALLCRENAIENTFYILLSGQVEVTKLVEGSEVRLMKTLIPGDFFGEMALIHNAPRAASVKTSTPVTVLEVSKEAFNSMLQRSAVVSMAMIREVSRRLRENDEMAIGDLRMKARELATAYQQLAELELARREFLTTIAHELRTPLMAASGYLQAIRTGMVEGEMLDTALDTVTRNVQEINSLVNDILFLQEMDLIFWDFQPVDVAAALAKVAEAKRQMAEQNNVILSLQVAPDVPQVQADARSLERALAAILDNAIKFSPEGGDVDMEVSRSGKFVAVRVRDRGVGIAPETLDRIFERFFHTDEVLGHLFRGVGLGLSIARQVIEQHGGKIEVDSEPGKGSTFHVRLPIQRDEKRPPGQAAQQAV